MQKQNKHPSPTNTIKLTSEYKKILTAICCSNNNFFITGKAGTGKSTLLNYLCATTRKKYVKLAPTGRSAVNIKGQTIHSFFSLQLGVLDPSEYDNHYIDKARYADMIIIDEISMVRADIIDAIDQILKYTMNNKKPFGGKQLIFFGDPFQLPPVVDASIEVKQFFTDKYSGPYYFNSEIYNKANFKSFQLTKVFRQENPEFVEILDRIRINAYNQNDLEFINKNSRQINVESRKVVLAPYRSMVNQINQDGLNSLKTSKFEFKAQITGDIKLQRMPTDENLCLKEGAKVMFVKNNPPYWVNGTLGVIKKIAKDQITVDINGVEHKVEEAVWEEYKYRYNSIEKKIAKEAVGTFTQIPLILAWAITIHKSQGATLSGVHINLDRGAFDYGQTYVALSRTKQFRNMSLDRPLLETDIMVDMDVKNYFDTIDFDDLSSNPITDNILIGDSVFWPVQKDSNGNPKTVVKCEIITIWPNNDNELMCEIEFSSKKRFITTLELIKKYNINME